MEMNADETKSIFDELGTPGIEIFSGYINEAHLSELRWPKAQAIYSRLRRSDPEVAITRQIFSAMARAVNLEFSTENNAGDAEKRFADFGNQAIDDIDGGPQAFIQSIVDSVPFYGWGWWEVLPGIRSQSWAPPDPDDDWRSEYNDNLIGIRRFAYRDPTSFYDWNINDRTGKLYGMRQLDIPNPIINIPLERSLHLTFGDSHNPEGLTPLEAVYRLERVKWAYELVMGIGYEHAAGYLEVRSTQSLTQADKDLVKQMARAIMSAQEANYAAWPSHLSGEIKDIAFAAGASLLEVIRFYHVLKLQLFNMQWAAIASSAGAGAYSAMSDSSGMFVITFNSMMQGFADQIDSQIGRRLLTWNKDKFPGLTRRPKLKATPVEKAISLTEIGQLISAIGADRLGPDDWLAIRKATKVLPEQLPEESETQPDDMQAAVRALEILTAQMVKA